MIMVNFHLWLDEQTPERKREIRAAENKWLRAHHAGVAEDPNESAFLESFIGYSDPPAGVKDDMRIGFRELPMFGMGYVEGTGQGRSHHS